MWKTGIVFGLMVFALGIDEGCGANILAISPVTSRSHAHWHRVLLTTLNLRGHNVTVLGVDVEPSGPNYTVVLMEDVYDKMGPKYLLEDLPKAVPYNTQLFKWMVVQCRYELESKGFATIKNYPPGFFDLVILDVSSGNVCFYPLIATIGNPPVVGTSPLGLVPQLGAETGDFIYPSISPYYSLPFTDRMTFVQRFINVAIHLYLLGVYKYWYKPQIQEVTSEFYDPSTLAQTDQIERNISTFLINTDPISVFPRPLMPNVIPVAGIHIKINDKLPQDIQQFLDEASTGAILFSLGTNVRSNRLSKEKRELLLAAFARLPYRVLWKWESDSLPGQPDNVMIKKWVPQCDVLKHPNVKLFFTHSGLLSMQEAIYFQVPFVGMPFFLDQSYNVNRAVQKGIALRLDYLTLQEDDVVDTLTEVITNDKFRKNIEELSGQFRDQQNTPLQRAVFWIERTIRHRGGFHFQAASVHLSTWEAYCFDVIAVYVIILGVLIHMLRIVFKKICKNIFIEPQKNRIGKKMKKS